MVIRHQGIFVIIVPRFSAEGVILVSQWDKNFLSQRECRGHEDWP